MKKIVLFSLLILFSLGLLGQQKQILTDLEKPHQIVVDGTDLYIFDEADYTLHLYTLNPFVFKIKIGQKGDGLYEFKYLPFVFVQPDSLACTDFLKTVWFSKTGEFLRVKNYSDFSDFDTNSEMLLIPAGENFLRITADHTTNKRHVSLLDSEFNPIRELYEGPFIWRQGASLPYRTDTCVNGERIVVSNSGNGFYFEVFDVLGTHLRTIDRSQDVEPVTGKPLLHQYCVSDDKIYATSSNKKEGQTEMLILDLKGTLLDRLYLPFPSIRPQRGVLRYDLFTVAHDKLYELVKNEENGIWELHITNLSH